MSIPDAAVLNLTIPAGQPWSQTLALRSKPSGQPIRLGGFNFQAGAWDLASQTLLQPITVTVTSSAQGLIELALSSGAVAALPQQSRWTLLVIQPSGTRRLWLRGELTRS